MTALTSFHLFPNLPSELRLKIWSFTLLEPRSIKITCNRRRERGMFFVESWTSDVPAHPALLVCQESRHEALSTMQPHFKAKDSLQCTYLDFSRDTIRLPDGTLAYVSAPELQEIQRMVIEVRDMAYFAHFNMEKLLQMRNLRELELLAGGEQVTAWGRNYVDRMVQEFEEARINNPGWECPKVRILHPETAADRAVIEGGAMIPGWVEGDDVPEGYPGVHN